MIQNWPAFRGDLAVHQAVVDRLSRNPVVRLENGVLEPAAYEALLAEADILLLPYDTQAYALQGSGVLTEGLARGKVILARAGAAAADEARAGVGFAFETPRDLAQGLVGILANFDELSAEAAARAERFLIANNPSRFLSALASRSRGLTLSA